jgi:voltage-gated potassium channel
MANRALPEPPPGHLGHPSEGASWFQILTLFLSGYVLLTLLAESLLPLEPEARALLDRVDFYVCMVFLLDFVIRFRRAPSKLAFMKWGWIDLLSSIPVLDSFRIGRLVRVIRILRALRSAKLLVAFFMRRRRTNSLAAVAAVAFVLVVFSAIAMLQFEGGSPEGNIKTPQDAFWWAYTTVTTVGYGDRFPVSPEGRVVACILMTVGVGLFGTFTGFIASLFVDPEIEREESEIKILTQEIQALRQQVQALETRLPPLPPMPPG